VKLVFNFFLILIFFIRNCMFIRKYCFKTFKTNICGIRKLKNKLFLTQNHVNSASLILALQGKRIMKINTKQNEK
jgi:hypothetical protein